LEQTYHHIKCGCSVDQTASQERITRHKLIQGYLPKKNIKIRGHLLATVLFLTAKHNDITHYSEIVRFFKF